MKNIFRNLPACPRKNEPSRKPEFEDAMVEYVSRELVTRATERLILPPVETGVERARRFYGDAVADELNGLPA